MDLRPQLPYRYKSIYTPSNGKVNSLEPYHALFVLSFSFLQPTKHRMTPVRNQIGDRLIPTRAGNNWQTAFHIRDEPSSSSSGLRNRPDTAGPSVVPGDAAGRDRSLFRAILENEVLNSGIEDPRELTNKKRRVFNVRLYSFVRVASVSVCSFN